MKKFNFDERLDRSSSASEKWNQEILKKQFGRSDLLPFWVADMEFKTPPAVIEQLIKRAQNGVFGYEIRPETIKQAFIDWNMNRHSWQVSKEQISFSQGVMNAISALINLLSHEKDGVIIQPPFFPAFRANIVKNKRRVVLNPVIEQDNHYQINFQDLEQKASDPANKLLILCNPHNPIARVWSREDLKRVADICKKTKTYLIADEIHSDIVFERSLYHPILNIVDDEEAQWIVSCRSPAKTFNIASATETFVVFSNQKLKKRFDHNSVKLSMRKNNTFSGVAMTTAYQEGEIWLEEVLSYIKNNICIMQEFIKKEIPQIKMSPPQGTYLMWLDFRNFQLTRDDLERKLTEEAKVALNPGYWFGKEGEGFARMSVACPQSMLLDGLSRMRDAFRK